MDWKTFFVSLFTSIGGALGVTLIILRFLKRRVETYIDDAIKYKFDKKLEEYKQSLNKQFSDYESFTKKYNDCIDIIIKELSETEKYIKEIQKCINRCLYEQLTLDFVFNKQDGTGSIRGLYNASQVLEQTRVMYQICLPKHIADDIEVILSLINNYLVEINRETENLQIDRLLCQRLLDSGKAIHNKVDSLSSLIREEYLRQSGEL